MYVESKSPITKGPECANIPSDSFPLFLFQIAKISQD